MSIDWSEVDKEMGGNAQFKDYAPDGEHAVKLDHVEIRDKENWKSPAVQFFWQEGTYKYPASTTHWLSIPKPNYRCGHNRNILMALGFDEAKAKQLIEQAEQDQDRTKLVKAYEALYKRVAERHPAVEIIVRDQVDRDGNLVKSDKGTVYSESDFKASFAQAPHGETKTTAADVMGEPLDADSGDIPF